MGSVFSTHREDGGGGQPYFDPMRIIDEIAGSTVQNVNSACYPFLFGSLFNKQSEGADFKNQLCSDSLQFEECNFLSSNKLLALKHELRFNQMFPKEKVHSKEECKTNKVITNNNNGDGDSKLAQQNIFEILKNPNVIDDRVPCDLFYKNPESRITQGRDHAGERLKRENISRELDDSSEDSFEFENAVVHNDTYLSSDNTDIDQNNFDKTFDYEQMDNSKNISDTTVEPQGDVIRNKKKTIEPKKRSNIPRLLHTKT